MSMEELISKADLEFENSWEKVVSISKNLSTTDETQFAIRRLMSYNPLNSAITQCDPNIGEPVKILTQKADEISQKITTDSENPKLWSALGHCYFLINDYPNALACYSRVKEYSPTFDDPYFWFCFGAVYQHLNYFNDALLCFNQATKTTEQVQCPAEFNYRLAVLYRSLGKYKESLESFESIVNSPPKKLTKDDILFQIAFTYQLMEDTDRAFATYDDLYKRSPKELDVLQQFMLFISFLTNKEYLKYGLEIVKSIPEQFANDPKVKLATARIYMTLEDLKESYSIYCECLSYWSDNPVLWCGLSELYFMNGQIEDAETALRRVIFLNPNVIEAWLNLSYISEGKDEKKKALKLISEGLAVNPDSVELKNKYADIQRGKLATSNIPFGKMSFFIQVAEKEGIRRISDPIDIPSKCISGNNDLQAAIHTLCEKRESLFH